MEPETTGPKITPENQLHQVTLFSKYLAMTLFIVLPFIGGWVGYTSAPEKIIEVEKVIVKEKAPEVRLPNETVEQSAVVNQESGVPNETVEQPIVMDQESGLSNETTCVVDDDCVLVQPDCEDCKFAAISKNAEDQFRTNKTAQCRLNPPKFQCDATFSGEIKCIENVCQLEE